MTAPAGPAPVPIPTSVSPEAQRFLGTHLDLGVEQPALDDTDGWLRFVETGNAYILERFTGIELPVITSEAEVAGVPTFFHRAEGVADSTDGPVYLDIHGGGLVIGGGEACRLMTAVTALTADMVVWAPDYRMPPLHPYPAALDDCLAVYRKLLEVRPPELIFVGGGSAGGNLAAALVVRARDEGLPLPAALILLTPEADLTESGDSFATNAAFDNVLGSLMQSNLLYANGHELTHPYLSPLFADLTGFPPTFLQTGTRDLYLSNTVRMHRKLRAAGVEAELHVFEAMPHGGFAGAPEDFDIVLERGRFLAKHRQP